MTSSNDKENLDISFVTDKLIAMSFPHPDNDTDPKHKNKINKVASYLNSNFEKNYQVINLCAEKSYDQAPFNNNVQQFPIDDYDVPSLRKVLELAKEFKQNENKVNVMHCMGGKGRTGTIMSCMLINNKTCQNSDEALKYFAEKRVGKNAAFKGAETPSQIRFVGYFDQLVNTHAGQLPDMSIVKLKEIRLSPLIDKTQYDIELDIFAQFRSILYYVNPKSEINSKFGTASNEQEVVIEISDRAQNLVDQIKFDFRVYKKNSDSTEPHVKFSVNLHAFFIKTDEPVKLVKSDLDMESHDEAPFGQVFDSDKFILELRFD